MKTIEELLEFLEETGDGCGLISDDAGIWAVSTSSMQNVPVDPPQDIQTTFFVEYGQHRVSCTRATLFFHFPS